MSNSQLQNKQTCIFHRPHDGGQEAFQPEHGSVQLNKTSAEFDRGSQELEKMENVCSFISNPLAPINVVWVAEKSKEVFSLPAGVDTGKTDLQNDIALKARSKDGDSWGLKQRHVLSSVILCTESQGLLWAYLSL